MCCNEFMCINIAQYERNRHPDDLKQIMHIGNQL